MDAREETRHHQIYEQAYARLRKCRELIQSIGLGTFHVDNVAILFAAHQSTDRFVETAVARGMEHFHRNEHDYVLGAKGQHLESYGVRFEFLRWPEEDWRIEAMVLEAGESAIHMNALSRNYSGFPVQGSFKVRHVHEMARVHKVLAMNGLEHVETFLSSYGPYAYWSHPALEGTYLKTRLNTRDREQ